ncbi:MAG: hypothetical protein HYT30_01940 [Parcubacteria group bacterium]|nr:hypothetical protein [Parcubacteria group bacterium]
MVQDPTDNSAQSPAWQEPAPRERALFATRRIPGIALLEEMLKFFSPAERALLYGFAILMGASAFAMLVMLNTRLTTVIPSHGGSLTEGIVGTPRFVNPLLAQSDPDRDVSALVYSGLMRATPDNRFIKDLAADMQISEDGTTYTFVIRDDAYFHDGTPVTAADVAFTIAMAQQPDIKSPRRADWEGVSVEDVDEKTVRITLPHPYAPFLENATLGILPKHLWQNVPIEEFPFHELNTHPIGSGPFMFKKASVNSSGAPERYTLAAYPQFTLGRPYLDTIVFNFYPNEDEVFAALARGKIESIAGIAPTAVDRLGEGVHIVRAPLPRIFGVFFNQGKSNALMDTSVRKALSLALDREKIIDDNLHGYGVAVTEPVLPDTFSPQEASTTAPIASGIEAANALLDVAGWKAGEDGIRAKKGTTLSFAITTADTPELAGAAESVARTWRLLGADVSVKVFSTSDLTNTVIRPRDYQALLFGEVVGRSLDLFAFWHSSQRNDPGLNLALYTNVKADKLLADARRDDNPKTRAEKQAEFVDIAQSEYPAAFLYAPEFIYAMPNDIYDVHIGSLTAPAERFLNVYEWHRETERVWDVFVPAQAYTVLATY